MRSHARAPGSGITASAGREPTRAGRERARAGSGSRAGSRAACERQRLARVARQRSQRFEQHPRRPRDAS